MNMGSRVIDDRIFELTLSGRIIFGIIVFGAIGLVSALIIVIWRGMQWLSIPASVYG